MFLPDFLLKAWHNTAVGLPRALVVLSEILEMLRTNGCLEQSEVSTIIVDLQDLAAFVKEVKSASVFTVCVENSQLVKWSGGLRLQMTAKNWHRMHVSSVTDDHIPQ